ncbi:MAG: energy transducer TonB [Betaproteobacteria bacterium]|nr:energy transducer TonB [Betaproteobacteria bacterium]
MTQKTQFTKIVFLSIIIHVLIVWLLFYQHSIPRISLPVSHSFQEPIELNWYQEQPSHLENRQVLQPQNNKTEVSTHKKQITHKALTRYQNNDIQRKESPSQDLLTNSLNLAKTLSLDDSSSKKIVDSITTQNSDIQNYEKDFRDKVVRIGSVNYPPPVNGFPLSGNVRISVVIDSAGHIQELLVVRSSGISALDQSAIKIIRLCEPFPPFSQSMKAVTEEVRITRTFVFRQADESVSSH